MNKIKKRIICMCMLAILALGGCGEANTQSNNTDDAEYLEGYENLSEEETTQKMLDEARKQEVVADKTE